ncbi:hypothetical protein AB0L05_14880 [Nonomuraea pusilla]|uniref:hypothetical protein n=1 Tax=Nonomuraea pusilla TaxID=46177 RepID=UPI00332CB40A
MPVGNGTSEGYEVLPVDLRRAMGECADQAPYVAAAIRGFAPAELTVGDFGLAPGASDIAEAYVKGTAEMDHRDRRFHSMNQYLNDLHTALLVIGEKLDGSGAGYVKAEDDSTLRGTW